MGETSYPIRMRELMARHGLRALKRFGQHFLVRDDVLRRIVRALDLHPGEQVWEIGPGIGALTAHLLDEGVEVVGFEIDRGFVSILREEFGEAPLTIVEGDVRDTWRTVYQRRVPHRVVGNLPYNVATSIILDFLEGGLVVPQVFMVQREVAERMAASVGSPAYGALSVIVGTFYRCELLFHVPPTAFYPRPKVWSSVLRLHPVTSPVSQEDIPSFLSFVWNLFRYRRKMLKNVLLRSPLGAEGVEEVGSLLERVGIDPTLRAEQLPLDRIHALWKEQGTR
ncbi:Ribosomal RNA small subunit methyltransferase A [Spirochaeta thermophila DSM 6578]|uniref:Ribosomal RNA small subunit methyltransferase A n=1 Tax=Winmispira thermophila (strain ATCC 700085 / DSM 6578 / Z-1203) TaxID=869211 RepID=G0GFF7_WINT7|nr:16S rRNA (adenine(1518)-N(6)/adenine(1519)-N(6))-dimethyltransferase RsmA [Spirochaeta thermophila]AEJ61571.1 Ribosomal RNA small subunit methyltransferase A [Spirochaeta thermophila DSM 6578]